MEFKDYYAVLGVEPGVDDKAIKVAYRKLARQYHPDVSKHADAEAKFKEVAEAYQVLHDPAKRAEYDEMYAYRKNASPGADTSSGGYQQHSHNDRDFTDFFESIFGARSGQSGFRREPQTRKGHDVEIELPLFLEETLAETIRPIEYSIPLIDRTGQSRSITKSLKVKIPAGIADGERIRVKGQGAPGLDNANNGDLYLHIRRVPHPLFDVEGHNLVITVPIAPWEAALGTKVTVPTLTGKIQLTIAPNSQSGQKLRIKGKGLLGKQGFGDLLAVLNVVMPDTPASSETQQIWQQLAAKAGFDARAQWSD